MTALPHRTGVAAAGGVLVVAGLVLVPLPGAGLAASLVLPFLLLLG